ncbi:MAG TPA: ribosome recycling factor [Ktedonobacterales bacterium]|jgi:ribosome recycling factor
MADDVFADVEHRMLGAVEALRRDLQTVRTGRASPSLVERLPVDYFGTPTPLQQLATIHATDARTLTIQPWDRKVLGDIEKAIQKSDLGLNPTNDGQVIRLVMPPLTEERRKDLVKVVHRKVDEGKVAVRNCRRDGHDHLRDQEKAKEISADDLKRGTDRLQKLTDRYIDELDKVGRAKEVEITAV